MKKKAEIKIIATYDDGLCGYELKKGNKKVFYEDLTRQEQIRVCNVFAQGYNLFAPNIKEED